MDDVQQAPNEATSSAFRPRWLPGALVLRTLADGAAADRLLREVLDAVFVGTTDDLL
ncbi:MAG TPA: hypothetical protein VNA28_16570 [Solirubrobacteraceae bacterium]|nr:hypothetical protein [Solirubrobacteraceae bacterium]